MGLGDGGGIRAGIAPYTDAGDVDRLVAAVERALGARGGRRRPIAEPRDDVPAR
jgi:hypothetical protein